MNLKLNELKVNVKKNFTAPDITLKRFSGNYFGQTKEGIITGKIDRHGFGIYIFKDSNREFHGIWIDDEPIIGYIINKSNNSITKINIPTSTNWDWSNNYKHN